ncbi:MAG: hypothetical protein ABIP51_18255 [Bacteroidia bacterium]
MKLTTEEIVKVMAMYWGCKLDAGLTAKVDSYWLQKIESNQTDTVLELIPLSEISDEHVMQIAVATDNFYDKFNLKEFKEKAIINGNTQIKVEVITQLRIWGYDTKQYFGFLHWANGKTAIELEIAIKK